MIVNPVLPPKSGYVEVVVDGKHTYRNAETGVLIENEVPQLPNDERISALEQENSFLKSQISAQSDQMDFYEECIVELAAIVYA